MQKKSVKKLIIFGSLLLIAIGIGLLFVFRLKEYQKHYDTSISKANAIEKETEFGQSFTSNERNTEIITESNKESSEKKKDDWSNRDLLHEYRGVKVRDGHFVNLSQTDIIPYAVFETEENVTEYPTSTVDIDKSFINRHIGIDIPAYEENTIKFIDTSDKQKNLYIFISQDLYNQNGNNISVKAEKNGVPFNAKGRCASKPVENYYGDIIGWMYGYSFWHQHIDSKQEIYPIIVSDNKGNILIQSEITIPSSFYSIYTGDNTDPFLDSPVQMMNQKNENGRDNYVSIDMRTQYNLIIYYMQLTEDYNQNVYIPILEVEPDSQFNEFTTVQLAFPNDGDYYFAFKDRDSGTMTFPSVRENPFKVIANNKDPIPGITDRIVECEGGLRIRSYPGGNSLGFITNEAKVTLINPENVAFEVLIDDIAGYWVNVQVKNEYIMYKDKPDEYTYGWIFSGYLK